jgi:hypothetical protein
MRKRQRYRNCEEGETIGGVQQLPRSAGHGTLLLSRPLTGRPLCAGCRGIAASGLGARARVPRGRGSVGVTGCTAWGPVTPGGPIASHLPASTRLRIACRVANLQQGRGGWTRGAPRIPSQQRQVQERRGEGMEEGRDDHAVPLCVLGYRHFVRMQQDSLRHTSQQGGG